MENNNTTNDVYIPADQAWRITERILQMFGDEIGGDPRIIERMMFRVVCGDGPSTFIDDDGEV
jgi:hypothetical protein